MPVTNPCRRGRRHHCPVALPAGIARYLARERPRGWKAFAPSPPQPRSGNGQGAQRRHQPTGARGAAGAHTARQGPEAAQRSAAKQSRPQSKRRGKARAPPATTRAAGAGAQSEPHAPPDKLPHKAPPGATGAGGAGAAGDAGGEGGEPPRRQDARQRRRDRSHEHHRARRRAKRAPPPGTRATLINRTDARTHNYAAGREWGAQAAGTIAVPGAARQGRSHRAQRAAKRRKQRQLARGGRAQPDAEQQAKEPGAARRASVQAARRTATRRAGQGRPAPRGPRPS